MEKLRGYLVCCWLGFSLGVFTNLDYTDYKFYVIYLPTVLLALWIPKSS